MCMTIRVWGFCEKGGQMVELGVEKRRNPSSLRESAQLALLGHKKLVQLVVSPWCCSTPDINLSPHFFKITVEKKKSRF